MADAYKLKAGQTLAVTVQEGRAHIRCEAASVSVFTRSSASFGPYLVDTLWLIDGLVTVAQSNYLTPVSGLIYQNAGAPDSAVQASLTVNPTGDDNSLIFTARAYGVEGNSISIAYADPGGTTAALAVSVFRQAITVSLAVAASAITSTAAEIKAAIEAHSEANQLVTVALDEADTNFDSGAGIVTAEAAAALEGGAGTGIGTVQPGGILVDTSNGRIYVNAGTLAAPLWATVVSGASVPATVAITLAESATTDGMDITLTVKDAAGATIAGVFELEWWISEAATGIGLTADSYSGDVTAVTGTELQEIVSKKHYKVLTAVSGVFSATAVASANPVDQYVAVRSPTTGQVIVSGASGTNWEGAA